MAEFTNEYVYVDYTDESYLPAIQTLVAGDLSEPYSVFTYRYFLHKWPELSILVLDKPGGEMVGVIVCKSEYKDDGKEGYIAMLTVKEGHRKVGIGRSLAKKAIARMVHGGCTSICLEAEQSNTGALKLYEKLGFAREERLTRYYLNGGDAFRLKLDVSRGSLLPTASNAQNASNVQDAEDENVSNLSDAMSSMNTTAATAAAV